jgi:hypothetical protein
LILLKAFVNPNEGPRGAFPLSTGERPPFERVWAAFLGEVSNILLFGGPPEASSRAINGGTGGSHGRGIVPIFREEGKHLVCRRFRRRG